MQIIFTPPPFSLFCQFDLSKRRYLRCGVGLVSIIMLQKSYAWKGFCAYILLIYYGKIYIQHAGSVVFTGLPAWVYFFLEKFVYADICAYIFARRLCRGLSVALSVSNICASIIMMQKVAANVDNVAADLCFRASEVRWLLMKIFFAIAASSAAIFCVPLLI